MSRMYKFKQTMNTTLSSSKYDSPTQRIIKGFTRANSPAQEKDTNQKLTNHIFLKVLYTLSLDSSATRFPTLPVNASKIFERIVRSIVVNRV